MIKRIFFVISLICLSVISFYIGDLQKTMLDPVIADPMFTPLPYKAPEPELNQTIMKWTEEELMDKELVIDKKIAQLEQDWYKARLHTQEPDDNYYRGMKNEAGEREGIGRVELPHGDVYMGEWRKNLRHGIGGLQYAGGDLYECEWAFGEPHGFGSFRTSDGYYYIGEFIAGQPNGFGRAAVASTSTYIGYFREGKPHGFGTWKNKDKKYVGEFVDGKKHGEGTLIQLKDNKVLFKGKFKNDHPLGAGWQPKPKKKEELEFGTTENLQQREEEIIQDEEEAQTISFSNLLG